jgi:hypothetical protein
VARYKYGVGLRHGPSPSQIPRAPKVAARLPTSPPYPAGRLSPPPLPRWGSCPSSGGSSSPPSSSYPPTRSTRLLSPPPPLLPPIVVVLARRGRFEASFVGSDTTFAKSRAVSAVVFGSSVLLAHLSRIGTCKRLDLARRSSLVHEKLEAAEIWFPGLLI